MDTRLQIFWLKVNFKQRNTRGVFRNFKQRNTRGVVRNLFLLLSKGRGAQHLFETQTPRKRSILLIQEGLRYHSPPLKTYINPQVFIYTTRGLKNQNVAKQKNELIRKLLLE